MSLSQTVATRVGRGVNLLDQFVPGWERSVDQKILQMHDGGLCIIGQRFGDFWNGTKELAQSAIAQTIKGAGLKLVDGTLDEAEIDAIHYGFDIDEQYDIPTEKQYSMLAESWNSVLSARAEARAKARRTSARKSAATRKNGKNKKKRTY